MVPDLEAIDVLQEKDLKDSRPVGLASGPDVVRMVEVHGVAVDVLRVFALAQAQELAAHLASVNIACILCPVELDFGDGLGRFQVRVRAADHEGAEASLRARWAEALEREGTEATPEEVEVDRCPACGAEVSLVAEECPDCGLFVGTIGTEDVPDGEPEEELV